MCLLWEWLEFSNARANLKGKQYLSPGGRILLVRSADERLAELGLDLVIAQVHQWAMGVQHECRVDNLAINSDLWSRVGEL